MSKTLAGIRQKHDRPEGKTISRHSIAMALAAFRETGQLPRFRDLKYVCLGAASIDMESSRRCLLAEEQLRDTLLHLAETVPEPRRQMKCFQSLLRAYWSFPLNHPDLPHDARAGFAVLRDWLARRFIALDRIKMRKPDWFVMLSLHAQLLTDAPCDNYASALLQGSGSALQLAVDDLAIPVGSWVIEEAVLAVIRNAIALADDDFRESLPHMLAMLTGRAELFVPRILAVRCLARLLSRYARCSMVSEHDELFDTALVILGNPWIRRTTWELHVRDENGWPDELARVMVSAWLKRHLIIDFFGRYSTDAVGDTRRLDYWLRFDPFIDDLWLAVSPRFSGGRGQGYDERPHRAKGRLLEVDSTAGEAIFMRLGDFVAVEFAAKGKPMTLFRWDSLVPEQTKTLSQGNRKKHFSISRLLPTRIETQLEHRDDAAKGSHWEQKFDELIRPIIWRSA
ncbi:MAG: EH signature domain-containing protein [Sterolibacterium sp.]